MNDGGTGLTDAKPDGGVLRDAGDAAPVDAGGVEPADAEVPDATPAPNDGGLGGDAAEGGQPNPVLDGGVELDGASDADSGEIVPPADGGADAVADAMQPDDDAGIMDAGPTPPLPDAGQPPLDCDALEGEGVELCDASADACGAVFTNGQGCTATCAAAGLVCVTTFENVENACARDDTRPTLACDSGHQSDYCECGRAP